MKKVILIGFAVVGIPGTLAVVAGIALVGGVLAATKPVVESSEQFLALVGQGKEAEAYAAAADGFRARHDEKAFSAEAKRVGLTEFASVNWHSRRIEDKYGFAEGTVTTKSGVTRPVAVRLVQEGGRWKVLSVTYQGVELTTPLAVGGSELSAAVENQPLVPTAHTSDPELPSMEAARQMVTATLLKLNAAIMAHDFNDFHADLASTWKRKITPEKLREEFQDFIEKQLDISAIENVEPIMQSPVVTGQGVLILAGHFPTEPSQVKFELFYRHDPTGWKLSTLSIKVGPAETADK